MVRCKNPFAAIEASGKLGDALQFANTMHGAVAGKRRRPRQPNTPAQIAARVFIAGISARWKGVSIDELTSWAVLATANNIPPYNAFVKQAVDRYKHKPERQYYNNLTDVFPAARYPAILNTDPAATSNHVTTGGPHLITWTFTYNPVNDDWLTIYHIPSSEHTFPHWRNIVAVLPTFGAGRGSHVITGLQPGLTTIYRVNVSRTGKPQEHFGTKTATVTD